MSLLLNPIIADGNRHVFINVKLLYGFVAATLLRAITEQNRRKRPEMKHITNLEQNCIHPSPKCARNLFFTAVIFPFYLKKKKRMCLILRLHVYNLRLHAKVEMFSISLRLIGLKIQLCGQTIAMMLMHPNEHPGLTALTLIVMCKWLS